MAQLLLQLLLPGARAFGVAAESESQSPTVLDFGELRILLCSSRTVRITGFSSAALESTKVSRAVVNHWESPGYTETVTAGGKLQISTAHMMVELDAQAPSQSAVGFYRRSEGGSWERMLTDVGRNAEHVVDTDGSAAKRISTQWAFETSDEGLYGGGSQQQGLINYRGAPIQLVQQNTEAGVPFFVSSRGWSILFDCSAEVWLNRLEATVKLEIDRSTGTGSVTYTPSASGLHHITASAGALAWEGDYVPLAVSVAEMSSTGGGSYMEQTLFNWSDAKNAPPYHTGRVHLQAGTNYSIWYDLRGFSAPKDRPDYRSSAQLFIVPPSGLRTFSLQGALDDFVDYYVFAGDSVDSSIALYREATGHAPLYPKWVFGFWQSRNHYKSQEELVVAAQGFRARRLPLDAIVQDWHYWGADDNWGPVWDNNSYPNPAKLARDLHQRSCHLMVSVWSKFAAAALVDQLAARSQLIEMAPNRTTPGTKPGEHWMDIWREGTAETFFDFVNKTMFGLGIDALWLDGSEPAGWPQFRGHVHPSSAHGGTPGRVSGNRLMSSFSLGVTSAVADGMRRSYPTKRTFTLTRASWAGQQRTGGALWTGDTMGTWSALRRQVAASINFGLSGLPFWSQDIGGFHRPGAAAQYSSEDYRALFTRWFQFGSFTPIFRVHGSDAPNGTEYWLYGDEVTANCNATARLRYRLLPYIYSIAASVEQHGATLQRGLIMDFPGDVRARMIADTYMFGPTLLVAPVLDRSTNRSVYLPRDLPRATDAVDRPFIDFWSGVTLASAQHHTIVAPLSRIPLFGRGGSILLLGPEMQWTDQLVADPMDVRVYRGSDATFVLYEDDGLTRGGANTTVVFAWREASSELTIGPRCGEAFPGMLLKRTFRVVAVRESRGVGGGEAGEPDVVVRYDGAQVKVTLHAGLTVAIK